jgi:hypothetical protein
LLGLPLFESDPVAIGRAAEERITYLRQLQAGPQGELAQRVLKEVWAARVLLLDPQKKAAYDAQLRQRLAPPPPPAPTLEDIVAPAIARRPKSVVARRKPKSVLPMILRLVGIAVVACGGYAAWRHFNPPMGSLKIDIAADERPGVELAIDGVSMPLPGADSEDDAGKDLVFVCAPGRHEVVLKRRNYEPIQSDVLCEAGQTRTITPAWKHFPRILLDWPEADRVGAVIHIDGKKREADRSVVSSPEVALTLPAGEHQLLIERRGFKPFGQKVALVAGEDLNLRPTWEKDAQASKGAVVNDVKVSWGGLTAFQADGKSMVSSFKADPNAPAEKQIEPDANAQAAARKRLEEKFNPAKATTPDAKLALAKQLTEAGSQPQGDLADAYMLQRTAAQMYLEAGDLRAAMKAIDKVGVAFLIDDLAWRKSAITQFSAGAADEARAGAAVEQGNWLIDRYLTDREYASAREVVEKLSDFCQRAKERTLRKQMQDRLVEVQRREATWQQYSKAVATLKEKRDDPEANQIVGLWRCLVEGDWKKGLPNLSRSSDARLQALAQAELGTVSGPQDQAKLGGQWFETANRFKDDLRTGMRARAGYWYQLAYKRLPSSMTKMTVEKRLAELGLRAGAEQVASADGKPAAAAADRPGAKPSTGPVVTTDNGPIDGRVAPLQEQLVAAYGSDAEMQAAVDRGLKWLAEHQYADGSWSYSHILAPRCGGKCPNPGERYKCRNAATALTLLAFLGAGNTHVSGQYSMSVAGGLTYLATHMKPTPGGISFLEPDAPYGHAAATMALCEAYAMTRDKRIGALAQQALMFIFNTQDPNTGAWRYDTRENANAAEINCWQVQALKAAHMGRLTVPPQVIKGVKQYFEQTKISARETGALRATAADKMTIASTLLSRIYLGWSKDDVAKDASQLARLGWGEFDFEFNLFATPVMFQSGGIEWTVWSKALRQSLLRTQITEGHAKGSWAILDDPKFIQGGRMYSTCVALLCLEVYYRYLPVYRDPPAVEKTDKPGKKRGAADPEVQWQPLVSGNTR